MTTVTVPNQTESLTEFVCDSCSSRFEDSRRSNWTGFCPVCDRIVRFQRIIE